MHHEHHPGCGHAAEQLEQLQHHAAELIGKVGCAGHCHHPEHQYINQASREQWLQNIDDDIEDDEDDKTEVKRKKKQQLFGGLPNLTQVRLQY